MPALRFSPVSTALLHGLPLLLVVALIALIYARTGKRKVIYRLPQPWTYPPILWSAVDEPIPAGHRGGGHAPHDAGAALNVGGCASGRW